MPLYNLPRDLALQRAVGDVPPESPPPFTVESAIQSDALLHRNGVVTETSDYAPLVNEGSIYNTNVGDRVRIVSQIATPDGIFEVITEAIDIGLASPVAVGSVAQVPVYELTDAQREEQAAANNAHNAAAREAALGATVGQGAAYDAQEAATAAWNAQQAALWDIYNAQQAAAVTNESVPFTSVSSTGSGAITSPATSSPSFSAPAGATNTTETASEGDVAIPGISAALAAAAAPEETLVWDGTGFVATGGIVGNF